MDLDALADDVLPGRFELGLGYQLVQLPAGHELAGLPQVSLAHLASEPLALLDLPHSSDYFHAMYARLVGGSESLLESASRCAHRCWPAWDKR